MESTISIIIPTYNEADKIGETIRYIQQADGADCIGEIIVADGNSSDGTGAIAEKAGVKVLKCHRKGRSRQMNEGVKAAKSDILYFLHADSIPPVNFVSCILTSIQNGHVAGSFRLKFDNNHRFLVAVAWLTRFKTTFLRFGDQSLFVRRDVFEAIGGFDANLDVMEDQDIARRLKKNGPFVLRAERITTSSRKFIRNGPYRLMAIFILIYLLYYLGASPKTLTSLYRKLIKEGKV